MEKCLYDPIKQKFVKPNPYIETMKKCKLNKISNCLTYYRTHKDQIIQTICDEINNRKYQVKPPPYTENHNTYQNRYLLKKQFKKFIKNLNTENCFKIDNVISLDKTLILKKRIGSKSKYGKAFLLTSRNDVYQVAAKIMSDDHYTKQELNIVRIIDKAVTKDILPHLPIYYKTFYCSIQNGAWTDFDEYGKNIKPSETSETSETIDEIGDHYILINELAKGDLKAFTSITIDKKELLNSLFQIYISILSLHILGIQHNDSHWGNFLYHKIAPGGCFEYEINGETLYLENIGYYWVIWDFGLSKMNREYNFYKDYYRVLHAYIPKYQEGWNEYLSTSYPEIIALKDMMSSSEFNEFKLFDFMINSLDIFKKNPIGEVLNKKKYILK
jgi:hypothetical protein